MSGSSLDDILNYFKTAEVEYKKNTAVLDSQNEILQSVCTEFVTACRTDKKSSDAVLLTKTQADSIAGLKQAANTFLGAYAELDQLTKNKTVKEKETAEAFVCLYSLFITY